VADIELDNGNFLFDISTGTGGGAPGDAANITYSGEVPDPYVPFDDSVETILQSLMQANDGTRLLATVDAENYAPYNPSFLGENFAYEDLGFLQIATDGNVNGTYKLEYSAIPGITLNEGDALYVSATVPADGSFPVSTNNTFIVDTMPSAGTIILNRSIFNQQTGYPDGVGYRVYRFTFDQPLVAAGTRVQFNSAGLVGYPFPKTYVAAGTIFSTAGTAANSWNPYQIVPVEGGYGFDTNGDNQRPTGYMAQTGPLTVSLVNTLSYTYRGQHHVIPAIPTIQLRDFEVQNLFIVSNREQYDISTFTNAYNIVNINNSGYDIVVLTGDEGENPSFTSNEPWAMDFAHVLADSGNINTITESIWLADNGSEEIKEGTISEILSGINVIPGAGVTYNITSGFIRTTYGQVVPYLGATSPTVRALWPDDDNRDEVLQADGRYYNILGTVPDSDETNAQHALIPEGMFSVDYLWIYQKPGSSRDLLLTKGDTLYTASELSAGIPILSLPTSGRNGYRLAAALVQKGGDTTYAAVSNEHELTSSSELVVIVPDLLEDLTSQTQFHTSRNLTARVTYNTNLYNGDATLQGWTEVGTPSLVVESGRNVLQCEDTSATAQTGLTRPMSLENLAVVFDNGNVIDYNFKLASGKARLQSCWTAVDSPVPNTAGQLLIDVEVVGSDTVFTMGSTVFTFTGVVDYFDVRVEIAPKAGNNWGVMTLTVTPPTAADAQSAIVSNWVQPYTGSVSENRFDTGEVANLSNVYLSDWLFTVFTSLPTVYVTIEDIVQNTIFIADGVRDWVFETPILNAVTEADVPDSATVTVKLLGEGSYIIRRNPTDVLSLINGGASVTGTFDGSTVLQVIPHNVDDTDVVSYAVIDITAAGSGAISLPPITAADVSYDPAQDTSPNPIVATELQAAVTELNAKIQTEVTPVGDYGLRYDRAVTITLESPITTFAMSAIEAKLFATDLSYAGETGIAHGMVATDQHAVVGICPVGTFTAPTGRYTVVNSTTSPSIDIVIKRSNFLLGEERLFTDAELAQIVLVGEIRIAGSTLTTNVIGPFFGDGTLNEYLTRLPVVVGRSIARNVQNLSVRTGRVIAESLRQYNTAADATVDLEVLIPVAGTSFAELARTFVTDYQWGPGGSATGNQYWDASDDALATVPANSYVVDTLIARSDSPNIALMKYIGEPMTSEQMQAYIVEDLPVPRDSYIVGKVVHTGSGIYTVVQRNGDVPTVNFDISTEYTATVAAGASWAIPNMTADEYTRAGFQFNGAHLRHGTEVFRVSDTAIRIVYDSVANEDFLDVIRPT
jgi:hypothetical protein